MALYKIVLSILGAGILIVGSIYVTQKEHTPREERFGNRQSESAERVRVVDPKIDHIRGNPLALVTIVEYSDLQCVFCARVHPTILSLVRERPEDVRWIYRHLPIQQVHPQAVFAAHASECVAELGGPVLFWSYVDLLFENQEQLNDTLYITLAEKLGVERSAFLRCQQSGRHVSKIEADLQNAVASGGSVGTPFFIVIAPSGKKFPFAGALPKATIEQIIDSALLSQ